jgi:hypothetical protein
MQKKFALPGFVVAAAILILSCAGFPAGTDQKEYPALNGK